MTDKEALDHLEWAWEIVANAGGGDWEKESPIWKDAAEKWRDKYFAMLPKPK